MTPRIAELEAAIAAIGRPTISFSRTVASLAVIREWDRLHPELAAQHHALVRDLEIETRRHETETSARIAIERAMRTSVAKLERSGIGDRTLDALKAPQDTEAMQAVKRWRADSSKTWLVLCGSKGAGKTVAAASVAREAIVTGSTAELYPVTKLAKLSGFAAGADDMERLKQVGVLVLDDAGTEVLNDWAKAQLFELIDYRHENYGRTIITSNLLWRPRDGQGLEARLGERIVDRILQAGSVVQLSAESKRRKP